MVSVVPGPGAVAFAAVVMLTMLAAQTFDPRLMWDAADVPSARPTGRGVAASRDDRRPRAMSGPGL